MPTPLFRKLIATIAIGFLCFFIGGIYFITFGDRIFLFLSLVLLLCCLIKGFSLYQTVKKRRYILLIGTCLELKRNSLRKTSVITFQLDDGSTFELSLDKSMKLHVNSRYELYFQLADVQQTSPDFDPAQSMRFLCLAPI